jgi:hypothetical protein
VKWKEKTEEGAMRVREGILSQISCADGREEAVATWDSDGRRRKKSTRSGGCSGPSVPEHPARQAASSTIVSIGSAFAHRS